MWHVSEYATVPLDAADFNAQFCFEDTYVVRWKYKVSLTGEFEPPTLELFGREGRS